MSGHWGSGNFQLIEMGFWCTAGLHRDVWRSTGGGDQRQQRAAGNDAIHTHPPGLHAVRAAEERDARRRGVPQGPRAAAAACHHLQGAVICDPSHRGPGRWHPR